MTECWWPRGCRRWGEGARSLQEQLGRAPSSWALCQKGRREVCSLHRAGWASLLRTVSRQGREGLPGLSSPPGRRGGGGGRCHPGSAVDGPPPVPAPLKGLSHGGRGSHPLIGARVWRGCRRQEIALGQSCPHRPALPPSFAPPRRPPSPCIPGASRLSLPASPQAPSTGCL